MKNAKGDFKKRKKKRKLTSWTFIIESELAIQMLCFSHAQERNKMIVLNHTESNESSSL